jgi:soluble lytic murein transglycosylase-like protein
MKRFVECLLLYAACLVVFILAYHHMRQPAPTWSPHSLSEQRDSIVALEARRAGVPVDIALAVSHVENFSGDSMAVSSKGAVGIMQIIPKYWQHSFEDECGCGSLYRRQRNACVGVRKLKQDYTRYRTWGATLRAYHGSEKLATASREYMDLVIEKLVVAGDGTTVVHKR